LSAAALNCSLTNGAFGNDESQKIAEAQIAIGAIGAQVETNLLCANRQALARIIHATRKPDDCVDRGVIII
jgi:hypothetical protein